MPYLTGENSKRTRVEPVFRWLRAHGGPGWPGELIGLAQGVEPIDTGAIRGLAFKEEAVVPPSPQRLAWMIQHADRLAPWDGRAWRLRNSELGRLLIAYVGAWRVGRGPAGALSKRQIQPALLKRPRLAFGQAAAGSSWRGVALGARGLAHPLQNETVVLA
jgi:hypothetical protein